MESSKLTNYLVDIFLSKLPMYESSTYHILFSWIWLLLDRTNRFRVPYLVWVFSLDMSITNRFRTETMYAYYIVMEIYVLGCMTIFSPFYCLCTISMPHHFPTMNFPWTAPKLFKTKFPLLSQFYSIKLHIHTTFFYPKWRCFQRSQTLLIY
jgi:hypothetical protein